MRNRAALAVILAATLPVLPGVGLAQTDSVSVFNQAIDARNRGDIVAMMALFTDDAVREDGSCQPPCVGLAAVRASFQKKDRKSTRLNSSHPSISYAVFCLKKKNKNKNT